MAFRADWYLWGGGAGIGALAEYADVKMRPVTARATNGELLALAALIAQAFGAGERQARTWGRAMDGAAGWAAGMLTEGLVRRGMVSQLAAASATAAVAAKAPSAPAATPSTPPGVRVPNASGSVGVPASAASAAFDLPMGGY